MKGKLVILAGGVSSRMKNSTLPENQVDLKLIDDAENKSKGMIRIGRDERPFLDYLLFNAREAGYAEIVIVISERDNSIKEHYSKHSIEGLNISFAVQIIPTGREKPLGTADALYQTLKSKLEWNSASFTMCNSDNLYSIQALKLMLESKYMNAMIDYDRDGLEVEKERIRKFALTKKDDQGFLLDIIEKPTEEEIKSVKEKNGFIGVSMNLFRFNYDMIFPFLETVPLHPVRQEKELPAAIKLMIAETPKSLLCYPLREHVPDLTSKNDILTVKKYLEIHYHNFSL
ncbi:MAG: sugar phosphate nucleotidyltransferase [Ignavibacteriales bacterium]|nr:sugar phosphate nucleotidyltransferase [Ignavibacteriales bacterium]